MTRSDFIAAYCQRSNITWERLSERRECVKCECGEPECEGWAMVPKDATTAEEIAAALRAIPWADRPSFLFAIREASHFCWDCGRDLDAGKTCYCTKEE